jgi:hypothetical protein
MLGSRAGQANAWFAAPSAPGTKSIYINCFNAEVGATRFGFQIMPRYYFCITNGKPHEDDVGEELRGEREAWLSAKRLARDIEDTLEPDGKWTVEVRDAHGPLYLIGITGRKLR